MTSELFLKLVSRYSPNAVLANELWLEITTKYSGSKRHYHTLAHLENMIAELTQVKNLITDWDSILFAVYYHDIVYKATNSSNEEDSAAIARQRLSQIGCPVQKITKCSDMIIATRLHELSADNDTNLLTDADLTILGQRPEIYRKYAENVRKEYSVYPDLIYNPGRKKVLQHFLEMPNIFKTPYFTEKYEEQARLNIAAELRKISA